MNRVWLHFSGGNHRIELILSRSVLRIEAGLVKIGTIGTIVELRVERLCYRRDLRVNLLCYRSMPRVGMKF